MIDAIRRDAAARGESLEDAVRHHVLLGIVERVARANAPLVLRGGLLTRAWIAPRYRPTRDLDFVGDYACDREATRSIFLAATAIAIDDDVVVGQAIGARDMWADTAFPGVRIELAAGLGGIEHGVQIDIGFNDPLVPPAIELAIARADGRTVTARAVRPETQLGWKLHALVEMGTQFRPKDLADLALIVRHVSLERAAIAPAIEIAFSSRGYDPGLARAVWDAPHWATKTARMRWEAYEKRLGALAEVVAEVRDFLGGTP